MTAENARNGSVGMPGITARTNINTATLHSTDGEASNWLPTCFSKSPASDTRVTMMAAADESSSAGICATSPSPMVSSEYWRNASPALMSCIVTPMAAPPIRLMSRIRMLAMASPRTNFEAPSIAP